MARMMGSADVTPQAPPTCKGCGRPSEGAGRTCPTCGWNSMLTGRRCVKCDGLVMLKAGEPDSPIGTIAKVVGAISGLVFGFLFGILGGVAFVTGIAALGFIWTGATYTHRCNTCDAKADPQYLNSFERTDITAKRVKCFVGAAVCGAISVGLGILWLVLAIAMARGHA